MALEGGGETTHIRVLQMEQGLYPGCGGAGAHHLRGGPTTQHDTEGIYDDALARAGLTREGIELWVESEVEVGDDREIGDLKLCKHCVAPTRNGGEVCASW